MINELTIRQYQEADLAQMRTLWNEIVAAGNAFPQEEPLSMSEAGEFFAAQSYSAVAELGSDIVGLYILHPNNIGRCGHLANASYAVAKAVYVSGAGSTVMAVAEKANAEKFYSKLEKGLELLEGLDGCEAFTLLRLDADNTGATVE